MFSPSNIFLIVSNAGGVFFGVFYDCAFLPLSPSGEPIKLALGTMERKRPRTQKIVEESLKET